jgi:hypothetical protein
MKQVTKIRYWGRRMQFKRHANVDCNINLWMPLFIFIILLQCLYADGQNSKENTLWVGQHNNYMRIDTDAIRVNYSWTYNGKKHFRARGHKYKFTNDTLRILEEGFHQNETYEYIVKEFSADKLTLTALNHNFRTLDFEDSVGRTLQFMSQEKILTDTIRFEKLLFSTTNCYGFCPAMIFEINNNGVLNFKGQKFAVKQGFYQARLSKEILDELSLILSLSELDKVENNSLFEIDAPTYTLDIYYNNKVKYIKTSFVPFVLNKLLNFLINVPQRTELKSMSEVEFKFSQ